MNVISLKDYAKQNNISYEAVRKQVVRYADELGAHIIRDGRQQFLDDEAVAFLDAKRQKNPVAIIQMDKDERIEALEEENKILLKKLNLVQDELIKEKDKVQTLLDEKREEIKLLEVQNADLSAEKENLVLEVQEEKETSQRLSDELTAFESMSIIDFIKYKLKKRKE